MNTPSVVEAQPLIPIAPDRPVVAAVKKAPTVCEALIQGLADLGIEHAFGLTGGAIAPLCDALGRSSIQMIHCRHEGGAAFAATEAHFASGAPTMVFTTTGPGLTNALTGLSAARWEGAKIITISATSAAAQRGRWACQETSAYTTPLSGLYTPGSIFHCAVMMEHADELPAVLARISAGLSRPGAFLAHISLSTQLQTARVSPGLAAPRVNVAAPMCSAAQVEQCASALTQQPFVIWAGFGARGASAEVRALAEKMGAPVMCSPRAKGVFPESHPLYLGVTGLGGHATVDAYMQRSKPAHVLVLGTRLGEPTSFWQQGLVPSDAFIHVDVDPEVPGASYPSAKTIGVQAEIRTFLRELLPLLPERRSPSVSGTLRPVPVDPLVPRAGGPVRARVLMDSLQRLVVNASDAIVLTESGNAFAWGNHELRFETAGRYRVSVGYGSMGHATTGVVGAALARGGKAVAVVGDGSMLMNSEVNTAVQLGVPAVWVVMNDAGYGMVDQGMRALGFEPSQTRLPRADFALIAKGMGAEGVSVTDELELDAALERAMAAKGPFVVDVSTDKDEAGPWIKRIQKLIMQGARGGGQ
ncbi:MAG: thiamine pyrophosphate-binding protein [Archangium sp.]|nr:thiamine pyrophosphate-binding protein [Archangium sp.]